MPNLPGPEGTEDITEPEMTEDTIETEGDGLQNDNESETSLHYHKQIHLKILKKKKYDKLA